MSDLSKREDAMGAVQDHFNANGFKGYDDGQKMMDRLKALPSAEAVHRWIPCSERLPSESGWYLITVQGCEKVADMGWYYGERDVWEGVSSEQQVIAWMPLPTPYTKGDNDEER